MVRAKLCVGRGATNPVVFKDVALMQDESPRSSGKLTASAASRGKNEVFEFLSFFFWKMNHFRLHRETKHESKAPMFYE